MAEVENLAKALVAAQAEFKAVGKGTENPFFHSKYADFAAIREATAPVLAKHNLAVVQGVEYTVVDGKVIDTLVTRIIHESGESLGFEMALKPTSKPQDQGSAITYAKRYAYQAILGIVAEADDDGNQASGNAKRPTRAKASDDVDSSAINVAVGEIVKYSSAAGKSKKEVSDTFQKTYKEAFVGSQNLKALQETAEHYRALAVVKQEGLA